MAYTTINKSSDYFNTKLYTGAGTSGSPFSLTGVGFAPDWTWIKRRDGADIGHRLFDTVRGATKYIDSSATSAETTNTSTLTAFGSDGFTLQNEGSVNDGSALFTSWNWKAGTTSGITTNGNTTITPSSYSFNQTAGFSILKFTGNGVEGAKLAHGLGTTPAMVIIKRTSTAGDWVVYHKNLTANNSVFLNYTDGQAARSPNGYIYSPDATNITLSNHGDINNNGVTTVAYCFAQKVGYSKIGSYVGNSNADGTFVYTGMKPTFLLLKKYTASGQSWYIYDAKRDGKNIGTGQTGGNKSIRPNTNEAEEQASGYPMDILSNGFKWRTTSTQQNSSGQSYIYYAVGQSIVGTNNVTAKAR